MKQIRDPFAVTPESFHQAIEDTLNKLEDKPMKKKFRWTALAVAAALIMITATGFAAAGIVKGIVDWNGQFTPITEPFGPQPTPTPGPAPATKQDVLVKMHDLIAPVPEMEYWKVSTETQGSGKYGQYAPVYDEMDSFLSAIDGFSDMAIALPEGYQILNAEVFYNAANLIGEMYSEEKIDSITLRKYHLNPPTDQDREGYGLRIAGEEEKTMSLYVFVYPSFEKAIQETGAFYIDEDDQYSVLELDGFDRALLFERGHGSTLIELIRVAEDGRAFSVSIYGNAGVSVDEMLGTVEAKTE